MKKNAITTFVMACLVSVAAAALLFVRADAEGTESRSVLAAEHACAKAFVDGEVAVLDRCISDDYVEMIAEPSSERGVAQWKTQSKQEWLDLVRSRRAKYQSVEIYNAKVFLHGDGVATVLAEYSQKATKYGKDYGGTGTEIDTWKKKNGHWQVISSVFP